MHHAARSAPGTGGARPPATAVLAAVVLTLLAALGVAGPAPAGGPAAHPVAAAVHHRDTRPHADAACDTACTVRAAMRQEPHREHAAPRGPLATCVDGTTVTPGGAAWSPAPSDHVPSSRPRAPHDRDRAPPAASGT